MQGHFGPTLLKCVKTFCRTKHTVSLTHKHFCDSMTCTWGAMYSVHIHVVYLCTLFFMTKHGIRSSKPCPFKNPFDEFSSDSTCQKKFGWKTHVLSEYVNIETVGFIVFLPHYMYLYIIEQRKKPSCVLHCDKTLWTFENTWEMQKTPACLSQMPVMFYHSVIHGLGFFIC